MSCTPCTPRPWIALLVRGVMPTTLPPLALASISSSSFAIASSGAARTLHPPKTDRACSRRLRTRHQPCPLGSKQQRWLWQICSHSHDPVVLESFVGVWSRRCCAHDHVPELGRRVRSGRGESVISESRASIPSSRVG